MESHNLIPAQRCKIIIEHLRHRGSVALNELVNLTGASISTIRRDLDELERHGSLKRTRGGAIMSLSHRTTFEPDYWHTSQIYSERKIAIGKAACEFLEEEQSVIFDSSSTVLQAAQQVMIRRLPVLAVTNDLKTAEILAESPTVHLKMLGGTQRKGSYTFLGEPGLSFLAGLHVDVCLLGIQAINVPTDGFNEEGVMLSDTSIEVAGMKRQMISSARQTILLADSSKIGTQAFCDVCDITRIHMIITDNGFPTEMKRNFERLGVEVVSVRVQATSNVSDFVE